MDNKVVGTKSVKMPLASAEKLGVQNSPISTPQGQNTSGNKTIKKNEKNAKKVIIKNATYSAEAIAAASRARGM